MAGNVSPNLVEPEDSTQPVELVLVVKGAGTQAPGDTLDLFTGGLWPAILAEDASATFRERVVGNPEDWVALADDRLPMAMHGEAARSGAHSKTSPLPPTVFEISTRTRRIWVREVNWEVALRAATPLKAVLREWRMATWVLLFEFFQWFSSVYRFLLPKRARATTERARNAAKTGETPELPVRFLHLYVAFWAAYASLLGVAEGVIWTAGQGGLLSKIAVEWPWIFSYISRVTVPLTSALDSLRLPGAFVVSAIWVMTLAFFAAIPSALRSKLWHEQQRRLGPELEGVGNPEDEAPAAAVSKKRGLKAATLRSKTFFEEALDQRRLRRGRPPSLSNALLLVLIAALLLSPINYVAVMLLLLAWQAALVALRGMLWRYRRVDESDVEGRFTGDLAGRFDPGAPQLERPEPRLRQQVRYPLFLYRAIVVVGLPLFMLVYGVAKLLQWTRILASIGKGLETLLQVWLGGIMGDVVSYAMDSSKAARIRSTVERELRFFHERPEVENLHVVAHSQGTAITFELLFRHLNPKYLSRIQSYLTLGSVLSYYHHADAVLDPHHYDQRFPPARYPSPDDFGEDFRWYNCWNLTDPITEFYGLDEFLLPSDGAHAESPLVLPDLSQEDLDDLNRLSPTNIKTPASLRHHSDYWTNQEWVQRPFARRLLGLDERWKQAPRVPNAQNRFGHSRLIFVLHSLAVALIFYVFVIYFIEPFHAGYIDVMSIISGSGAEASDTSASGIVGGLLKDIQAGLMLLNDARWADLRTQFILYGMLLVPAASWISLGWATLRTFLFSRGKSVG